MMSTPTASAVADASAVDADYPPALAELDTSICAEVNADTLVRDAYRLTKPLTGLEIYGVPTVEVEELVAVLDAHFHVDVNRHNADEDEDFSGVVYVSRFRTLPRVAAEYGLSDTKHTDLAGVLFGYDLPDVADYSEEHGEYQ